MSCHRFRANEVRLQLSVLAYNLENLWRLVLPTWIDRWSVTSLQQRLVKTRGRLVRHARYYWLLLAESPDASPVRVDAPADMGVAGTGRLTVDGGRRPRGEERAQHGRVSTGCRGRRARLPRFGSHGGRYDTRSARLGREVQ